MGKGACTQLNDLKINRILIIEAFNMGRFTHVKWLRIA